MIESLEHAIEVWHWPHFKPDELRCKHCGALRLDESFMDRLESLRVRCQVPFAINSGYRCLAHDEYVSGSPSNLERPHPSGHAADVACFGEHAALIEYLARKLGFTGIGWRQHGPTAGRYVHLDDLTDIPGARPRPWIWSYPA